MINGTITFIIYWALPAAGLYAYTTRALATSVTLSLSKCRYPLLSLTLVD